MSVEMNIPLTFATFYTCGIKQSTNLTQRNCIKQLLIGHLDEAENEDSISILSDSVCSNYAKGKKNLTNELRLKLLNLTIEEATDRLKKLDIQDFTIVANALHDLVADSSLNNNEKKRLLKCYESKEELEFIAEVFLNCLKGNNSYLLSKPTINHLENYWHKHNSASATSINDNSPIFENNDWTNRSTSGFDSQAHALTNDIEDDEDYDWMRNHLPVSLIKVPPTSICDPVMVKHSVLVLPNDASALIYALKPTLTENAYEKFTLGKFIKTMNIDNTHNPFNLEKGSLECWEFEGAMESLLPCLKNYNFTEVSDFALQLTGEFTRDDVEQLKQNLTDASNDNVNILTSLIFDKEQVNVKLTLIIHKCTEKVEEQKLDTDHDGTRRYTPRRSADNNLKH